MGKAAALAVDASRVVELLADDNDAIEVVSKLVTLLADRRPRKKPAKR